MVVLLGFAGALIALQQVRTGAVAPADPCEAAATGDLAGLQLGSIESTGQVPHIAVGRDATATVVVLCLETIDSPTPAIETSGHTYTTSGGWVTSRGGWHSSAFVYPPLEDARFSVVDRNRDVIATAVFGDPVPPPNDRCVEGADPLITGVVCGFNVLLQVPVPNEIEQPTSVQSMVPLAWVGPDRSFLSAFWYGVNASSDMTDALATIAVRRSVAGHVSVGWEEVTIGSGEVLHPHEEYQFDLVLAK